MVTEEQSHYEIKSTFSNEKSYVETYHTYENSLYSGQYLQVQQLVIQF
jgi:hypothetical protein